MSPSHSNFTPDDSAGLTGNASGAPYSAAGHSPDSTTVSDSMAYRQSQVAANDKPLESDPVGNAIIGGVAGGAVGFAGSGGSLLNAAAEGALHFAGDIAAHFIKESVTDSQREDPNQSAAPHSSTDQGTSSSGLTCSNSGAPHDQSLSTSTSPVMSYDPGRSVDSGVPHDSGMSSTDPGASYDPGASHDSASQQW